MFRGVQRCTARSACSVLGRPGCWRSRADASATQTFSDRGLGPRRHRRIGRPRRRWDQAWVNVAGETWWRNAGALPRKAAAELTAEAGCRHGDVSSEPSQAFVGLMVVRARLFARQPPPPWLHHSRLDRGPTPTKLGVPPTLASCQRSLGMPAVCTVRASLAGPSRTEMKNVQRSGHCCPFRVRICPPPAVWVGGGPALSAGLRCTNGRTACGWCGRTPGGVVAPQARVLCMALDEGGLLARYCKVARYDADYRDFGFMRDMGGIGAHDDAARPRPHARGVSSDGRGPARAPAHEGHKRQP